MRSHSCKAFYTTIISKQTFHLASFPCLPTVQFLITFGATGNEANIHPGIKTIALKPPIKYGTQPGKVYSHEWISIANCKTAVGLVAFCWHRWKSLNPFSTSMADKFADGSSAYMVKLLLTMVGQLKDSWGHWQRQYIIALNMCRKLTDCNWLHLERSVALVQCLDL